MVVTFEAVAGGIGRLFDAPTLAAASSLLPGGAYTTLRTYGGTRVVRLRDHVRRLATSVAGQTNPAGPQLALDEESVRALIAQVVRTAGHAESRLRLTFAPPRLFLSIEALVPLALRLYEEGVRCVTVSLRRQNPKAKDTRFVPEAERAYRALPEGVHEGLLVGEDGALLEGLSSNFFAWHEEELRTEEERALDGVTRSMVLEVALSIVPVRRVAVRLTELPRVAECFLTSASRGILPVVAVDGGSIGSGRPGPLTMRLMRLFDELLEREAEKLDES